MLTTETPSSHHTALDLYPTQQLIDVLIDDQLTAIDAVRAAAQISSAVMT